MKKISLFLGIIFVAISCEKNQKKSSPDQLVRYTTHVKPIIENNCISCHDQTATIPMNSSENVAMLIQSGQLINSLSSDISQETPYLHMPPNISLPADKIDTLIMWEQSGFPE